MPRATTTPPPSLATASLVLFGLAALAITQPLLDILGQNAEVVVALNDQIAGTVPKYQAREDEGWRFDALLADFFVDGENTVAAFEVEPTANGPVLHRLHLVAPS